MRASALDIPFKDGFFELVFTIGVLIHIPPKDLLVAMDAAPVSYLMNLGLAADAGVTVEEVQGTLIAIAPVVGSARVASASGKILRAAFGVAVAEAEGTVPEQRKA